MKDNLYTYKPIVDTMTRAEAEALILTDLDFEGAMPCQLEHHDVRCVPGDAPAEWFAIGGCPMCKKEYNMLVCEPGRVRKITAPMTGCTSCGATFHWSRAIQMVRMDLR